MNIENFSIFLPLFIKIIREFRKMSGIKYQAFVILLFISGLAFSQNTNDFTESGTESVQPDNLRSILNKFSFNFTAGYGRTFYSTNLNGYAIVKNPTSQLQGQYLFSLNGFNWGFPAVFTKNWQFNPVDTILILTKNADSSRVISSKNTRLVYKGNSAAYPFTLSVFYEFQKSFRIGGGVTLEFQYFPVMNSSTDESYLGKYYPERMKSTLTRYFGMAGYKIYERYGWTYYVDVEIGKLNMGNGFNNSAKINGLYYCIGAPIEYEFSEYLKGVIRPSIDYKGYSTNSGFSGSVNHLFPAFYLNFGFRYNIPEIPRCPLHASTPPGYDYPKNFTNKTCRIQKKHVHGNKAYRGQPFYKPQNPEIGQNYRTLVRYKLFNRHKLSGGY